MKLAYTRKMLSEALAGHLDNVEYVEDPVFGVSVPTSVEGVPSEVLVPKKAWSNPDEYDKMVNKLAEMFVKNFEKFADHASDELLEAAPKVLVKQNITVQKSKPAPKGAGFFYSAMAFISSRFS